MTHFPKVPKIIILLYPYTPSHTFSFVLRAWANHQLNRLKEIQLASGRGACSMPKGSKEQGKEKCISDGFPTSPNLLGFEVGCLMVA